MFGSYEKTLDSKNRLVIPSKFRDELGETFYITLGFEKSLEFRSKKSFEEFSNKISSNNLLDSKMRELSRYIFANTIEVSSDKLGRVIILDNLLKKAEIEKDAVIVGVGNKAELWSKEKFEKITNIYENEENIKKLTQELFEKGAVL
ncbi:division/cell wall cluster transcriptional repressor MraZ [[Mycoplasma] mobile]|uniref:Transcriptional regulator MraZ n=1 Tax=Mycoplasma mobile (strain ATCC 43663 / 163K / NCTC 11711) TaxID=267748 RepID=MRAZ_MYCM1|nr:division/cell wall cluster transcriptional repressor MraZ [[Mycoplasma] mobile]Q6KHR3.1 RecName: Full=Transcriptional regulator MraZ [Mycoplasma mobile 163K]AAT27865.1 expressed protein [Mycoplasma mobile 163K]